MNRSLKGWSAGILSVVACAVAAAAQADARDLGFDERVAAQRAIEEVFWRHRIWPRENPGPKPPLSAVLSDAALRTRVADSLKKSNVLASRWGRPITGATLQAELDRLAQRTRNPEVLEELYAALGNDGLRVAETLARPALVERWVREEYAWDERLHGPIREEAERALARAVSVADMKTLGAAYEERTVRLRADDHAPDVAHSNVLELDAEAWAAWRGDLARRFGAPAGAIPLGRPSRLEEHESGFFAVGVLALDADEAVVATVSWPKRPLDSWWREERERASAEIDAPFGKYRLDRPSGVGCTEDSWEHRFYVPQNRHFATAVWTGTEMIVWGGEVDFLSSANVLESGGRYNPATDTWAPTSTGTDVPAARGRHTAVWTGSEMIVWGGFAKVAGPLDSGGRYDPVADTWTPTSIGAGVPDERASHTAVWTGTEMIVWGGRRWGVVQENMNTGGRYDPATDTWTATSTGAGVPAARAGHTAVWTGAKMIVWGGGSGGTGGRYDPSTNTWAPTTVTGAPSSRWSHTAVWTGTEMVVWGGANPSLTNTGARYDPTHDVWSATSTGEDTPSPRSDHTAVWTGTEMIVWGGSATVGLDSGGRYDPVADTWSATSIDSSTPSARYTHVAVWTGTEMIVWGGFSTTGGRYDPTTDRWTRTSTGTNVPSERTGHDALWTGTEMIVTRGSSVFEDLGARYNPATDLWVPMPAGPGVLPGHTTVWTGTEMIAWGGNNGNTGARYDPTADAWAATSQGANVPAARSSHSAVWTGSEMIVWGGYAGLATLASGGRYDPIANTWAATSQGANVPLARRFHTAVWTGGEMIVWGGVTGDVTLAAGARYDPAMDTWTATSTANEPSGRYVHTALWTGAEMIVWGGATATNPPDVETTTGGRYRPATDAWTSTSTGAGAPSARRGHAAVWTGAEMIVWGGFIEEGSVDYTYLRTGGRYDPATDGWTPTTLENAADARSSHTAVWTGTRMLVWGGTPFDVNLGLYCARPCLDPVTSYRDADGDGFGDPADTIASCDGSAPSGYAAEPTDCDDGEPSVYSDAPEQNDGWDNQCPGDPGHGVVDELAGEVVHGPDGSLCWSDVSGATLYQVARSATPLFDEAVLVATVAPPEHCVFDPTPPPPGSAWYYLVRALEPFAGSWGVDSSGTERTVVFDTGIDVDQANLVSSGNLAVSTTQHVGQTVTVGIAGQLVGFEFAPLADTLAPDDVLLLDVQVLGTSQSGTAMLTASGFPPGGGIVPAPLTPGATGPGYFDLAPLGITVEVGQVVQFELRPGWASPAKSCRAGDGGDTYAGGSETINGSPFSGFDLAFKTFVQEL